MSAESRRPLESFCQAHDFSGKGALCVALVVTRHARDMGLPLEPDALLTQQGGQVLGLGQSAVQNILKDHGIDRVLAQEGGRTSRGSLAKMRQYVDFLNQQSVTGPIDLSEVESYWIDCVRAFFAGKPFRIKLDASRALRTVIRDVIDQAEHRQKSSPGMYYAGAVLQHLVGAKLDCALGIDNFEHHSFSTSDQQSGRVGDFSIGDVAVHVTTAPSEAVIARCADNLNDGHRPILVTLKRSLPVAEGLAENMGLADRIDVFEIEQFVALNLYELGRFEAEGRKLAVADLVNRYNEIIDTVETDPSLRIKF